MGLNSPFVSAQQIKMAQAVLAASYMTDEQAAEQYGINVRTLEKWRRRMMEDPDFVAAIQEQRKLLGQQYAAGLEATLTAGVNALTRIIREVVENPDRLREAASNPAMLSTLTNTVERLSVVHQTERVLDARLGGLEDASRTDMRPPATGGEEPRQVAGGTVRKLGPGIVLEDD